MSRGLFAVTSAPIINLTATSKDVTQEMAGVAYTSEKKIQQAFATTISVLNY